MVYVALQVLLCPYISTSNNLTIEDSYPKKSDSLKNYYEIYKLKNKIHGTFEYFIFIAEDSSQLATLTEIKSIESFETEPRDGSGNLNNSYK